MKHILSILLCSGAIALAGCQTFDGVVKDLESIKMPSLAASGASSGGNALVYDANCPAVEAVDELSTLAEFTNPAAQSKDNMISYVEIADLRTACEYDTNSVTVDLKMSFEGQLGPMGRMSANDRPFFSYPFFVAVTSASGKILAKEVFGASMTYNPGQTAQVYNENMRQIIPLENRDTGANYKILVGFQLTPDQLAYNRAVIRARMQEQQAMAQQQATQNITIQSMPVEDGVMLETQENSGLPAGKVSQPVDIINNY